MYDELGTKLYAIEIRDHFGLVRKCDFCLTGGYCGSSHDSRIRLDIHSQCREPLESVFLHTGCAFLAAAVHRHESSEGEATLLAYPYSQGGMYETISSEYFIPERLDLRHECFF